MFRTYGPSTGRFLEPDPIGLAADENLYAYVAGDPINLVDPLGLRVSNWVPYWGGQAGRLRVEGECDKSCPVAVLDEDSGALRSLPEPGSPEIEIDAIYSPLGALKIPDNFTCVLTCLDGRVTTRCFFRWDFYVPGKKPVLFRPGSPLPGGFPPNPFAR